MADLKDDRMVTVEAVDKTDEEKAPKHKSVLGSLSFVDRFLSLWIISVMVIGVVVGYYSPVTQEGLSRIDGAKKWRHYHAFTS